MTCGFGKPLLDFPSIGVKIRPYSIDLRMERDKLDHCQCEIHKEAAELLVDKTDGFPNQPVDIYIEDDKLLRRMYLPPDAIQYDENGSEAFIKLMDPLAVLKQGTLDKKFNKVKLHDAISYVMDQVPDTNGTIFGWDISDPDYSDNYQPNYEDYRDESLFANAEDYVSENVAGGREQETRLEQLLGAQADGTLWVNRQINNVLGVWGDIGELDFNKKTPYEAIKMIADEWELDFWVNSNRYLMFGKREAKPNTHIITPEDDTLAVSEYNITESAFPVAEVVVKGKKVQMGGNLLQGLNPLSGEEMSVQVWGQARVDGVEHGQTLMLEDKSLDSGESLRDVAEQRLINEMIQNKSGNLILNPAVSGFTEYAQPHTLTIGDLVVVDNPPGSCGNFDKDGGNYMINSIHHQMSGGDGWEITVEVGNVPSDDIRSHFILYDLDKDEVYSDADDDSGIDIFIL